MKKTLAAFGAAFLLFAAVLFAPIVKVKGATPTTLFSVWVQSSQIDSTTIGATTPSSGVFTSLNSTSGALNGTIGATTANTGAFTSITATSATVSGLTSGNCVQASTGGLLTTSALPCVPTFTGTSGYQTLPSGLILEWAQVSGVPTGTGSNYSLPFTFPHACFGVNATDNGGSAIGSNPRSIGSGCTSNSQIWLIASGTPSGSTFYTAIGY